MLDKQKVYLSIVLLFTVFLLPAQELTPLIKQYTSANYQGASQNWDIEIGQQGLIYAANHQGLLRYDGINWDLFKVNDGSIIRSVFPNEDRIYIGAYEEFGYWSTNQYGEMEYTSLLPLLEEFDLRNEEFWEILEFNNDIYFRSFAAIYKYDPENEIIERIKTLSSNHLMVFQEKLLVAVGNEGLYYIEPDGTLRPFLDQPHLQGKRVVDAEVYGDSLFIGTRNEIFLYDGEDIELYGDDEFVRLIARSELNHLIVGNPDELLIGTVKNGLLQHKISAKETMIYNRRNGLQNNTILALAFRNGKLWLALDNGIDAIDLESPVHFYTDNSGELGASYDVSRFHDEFYIASNTGTYRLNGRELMMIEGSRGHNWGLEILENNLYSNHNTGTYKLVNDRFIPVEQRTGSFRILNAPESPGKLFIANYTGISIFDSANQELQVLEGVNFPIRELIFENPHTLWAEHAYEGVYRIRLQAGGEAELSLIPGANNGKFKSKIFRFDNSIAVFRNKQWYRYNVLRDSLEPYEELKEFHNHELLLEDDLGFWFVDNSTNSIKYTDFRGNQSTISSHELDHRLVKGNERMIRDTDSTYLITLKDGFAQIDLNRLLERQQNQVSKPMILGISDSQNTHTITGTPQIPYESARNLKIRAGLPSANGLELYYELKGAENLAGRVDNGILRFQRLPAGSYELNLMAKGPDQASQGVTSLSFSVEAPWYLSNWMIIGYVLLGGLVVVIVRLINRKKLQKHRAITEQQLQQEHQKRMNFLEKERLEKEVMLKRKELANTTMVAAKKNEVLMEIQTELRKDKENFSNQYRLKHLMNKVNQAIQNKDEWQVFETNFEEVHEDFFKDLLERFPELTSKDLKLCSYLKMNLTTKEIAPLMGKSVRGVEVHRYRLRKKLDLPKEENLVNYFIKNF